MTAQAVRTQCPYCGVGCGLIAEVTDGRLTGVRGDPIHPVNRGRTCRKPLELVSAVDAQDRAVAPMWRDVRDGRLEPGGWDDVLGKVTGKLRTIIDEHGPDAVAFYISGQLLTEDYYAVNKLAKGLLGTNNVDSNSRLCMSSAVAGYTGAFGSDGPPPSYADIALADCFFLLGTNTAACHPIVWSRIRDRQAEGAFVICADPRATPTATGADLHLPVRPGTDLPLLSAMLHVIDRDGLVDEDFVARRTSGWEQARAVARDWPPSRAAEVCGVPAEDIELAARKFAAAGGSMAMWSMGANQSTVGTLKNRGLINLCLATGQIGRPGAGPLSLTGQPNAMGGRETGGLAQLLPGYRKVEVAEDRIAIENHWGLPPGSISPSPGLAAIDLFDALADGRVKAVWVVATNPLVSLPNTARAREALARAELVVVQDAYHPTETSSMAHAVLPAAAWPEKDGAMTNSERRVALVRRAADPPGAARPDWQIFAEAGRQLGFAAQMPWASASEVFDEFVACTAGQVCDMSGLSHERLRMEGSVQWPAPASPDGPNPERLYPEHRFPTPDGRARFAPTPHEDVADPVGPEHPLLLTSGRVADQWHTMTRTGKSPKLRAAAGKPFVELHPDDAVAAGVADGDDVRVVSRRGFVVLRAKVTEGIAAGVAFAPFHWGALHAEGGAGIVNDTTIPAVDPTSKQPELKAAAVRIEPVRGAGLRPSRTPARTRSRLVVVGTGMAGLAVVEEALKRDADLAVTMLGEEVLPPYNRVLLSKLLARDAGSGELELRPPSWFNDRGVDLRGGLPANSIDTEARTVTDQSGHAHPYDALVLATGSRAFVPPIPGADLPHVGVFRTWRDADALAAATPGAQAVVLGGGLLGLEAAAGLRSRGVRVTVVELAPRLMGRQLDDDGAAMLKSALAAQGLGFELGVSVARIQRDHVVLSDDRTLPADMVVVAVGVRPETTLAREAGIEVDRGIVVDDEMHTSADGVWAAGECVQHRGTVYGLWAPLAQQSRVAGARVAGDPGAFHGAIIATTLKVSGVGVYAGGVADTDLDAGHDEVIQRDTRKGVYRKLVLEGDRLAGAVLLGDTSDATKLTALLRSGDPVPEALLNPSSDVEPVPACATDTICACNAVTRGEITTAIAARDLRTVAQVGAATRASTGCGGCAPEVERILAERSSDGNTTATETKPAPATMAS
ncbi:MAG: molybdopterin-dependent oxidoreductase [Solirubrobacteraceae bacterium]|nr:molybdopterin-dependent oxidoreductase [Solirubrobacteraceae bacterium]